MTLSCRTPLRTSAPLQRRTRLRARAPWRKKTGRRPSGRKDSAYLAFIRTLPCIVPGSVPGATKCWGAVEASHVTTRLGLRGVGIKVPDKEAVSHCRKHHRAWETRSGEFAGWSKEERLAQAANWVHAVRLLATPEDREQARVFEALGIGRWVGDGWVPGPGAEVTP